MLLLRRHIAMMLPRFSRMPLRCCHAYAMMPCYIAAALILRAYAIELLPPP